MTDRPLDVLFVSPNSAAAAYQDLSKVFTAIEPPVWALLLAQATRARGFGVGILDCDAERLDPAAAVARIADARPRLVCFVVYGQNPNSGTISMSGAVAVSAALREAHPDIPTCFVGSHTSALPKEVLALPHVDFVLLNEGVYALQNLLRTNLEDELHKVKGIGFKRGGVPMLNPPERVVPQERMDADLPGYAWDLLPKRERPLDLYRAHFWHAEFDHKLRTPFAALYTSLGCRFRCDFCMINIVNRVDNADHVNATHSPLMRFWSTGLMLAEFEKLAAMGVETIRISDEMFFLDRRYYEPLVQGLADRRLGQRLWAYARVDTVKDRYLELFQRAGIGWLCLGIEAAQKSVRKEISKGTFEEVDVRDVTRTIQAADIKVLGNFIFGTPDDTLETMEETLQLALELNTEHANFYPCMGLPGSALHHLAKKMGWPLPQTYSGYGFLAYDALPLPTKHLPASEVLRFRDEAWQRYFSNPAYLALVERKFGAEQRRNVEAMARVPLRRKLLEEAAGAAVPS